jgi:hypothetical protein
MFVFRHSSDTQSARFLGLQVKGLQPLLLTGLLCWGGVLAPEIAQASIPQATNAARQQQQQQQWRQVQSRNYDLRRYPVYAHERHWRNILWTTAVVEPQEAFVAEAVDGILQLADRPRLTAAQQRTISMTMQVATQLYLSDAPVYDRLHQRFRTVISRSPNPQWVAMSLSALQKGAATTTEIGDLSAFIKRRFPWWRSNTALFTTLQDVDYALKARPLPPLQDLFNWTIAPGQPQLYVICPPDRSQLCLSVLKNRKGQFVRELQAKPISESKRSSRPFWSVPLLLESIHRLNWNFSRGQTPQGIYRIQGTVPQPDFSFFRAYGQFPLVNLLAPNEPGTQAFVPGRRGSVGSLQAYKSLLPKSWRNYFPIQQSYWASKSGRGLFRIHGTGEAPDFFNGKQNLEQGQDWNPTIGCLSALELYDGTGKLHQSDMPKILQALQQAGGKQFSGYLIVVELPAIPGQSLTLSTLTALLNGMPLDRLLDEAAIAQTPPKSLDQPPVDVLPPFRPIVPSATTQPPFWVSVFNFFRNQTQGFGNWFNSYSQS